MAYSPKWDIIVDTAGVLADSEPVEPGGVVHLAATSLVVLRAHTVPEPEVDHSVAASLSVLAQSQVDETSGDPIRSELQ